jgi:hypothetical protein
MVRSLIICNILSRKFDDLYVAHLEYIKTSEFLFLLKYVMIYAFFISFYCCSHEKKHKRSLTPVFNKKPHLRRYMLNFSQNSNSNFSFDG